MNRTRARDHYDALIRLENEDIARRAYALIKRTYRVRDGACELALAEPLLHDFTDPSCSPRLRPGTDYWPRRALTDFVVQGDACAPEGREVREMTVSATLADRTKQIQVFGRRVVSWRSDGTPRFHEPEPFTRVPLCYDNAYGGCDWRVPDPGDPTFAKLVATSLSLDHPGMYPRNPFGKGYVVALGTSEPLELPNLEDPTDLLDPARLLVPSAGDWYRQPLPWCFDWLHPMMFPRYVFFGRGVDAWVPGPEDEGLPEVRRGFLQAGYRSAAVSGCHPRFFQEASLGMSFSGLRGGEPVCLEGMSPERPVVEFVLPAAPRVEAIVCGERAPVEPSLHSVVVRPATGQLTLTYSAWMDLPRAFMAGLHRSIPIAVLVDGDRPIEFETPPTVADRLGDSMKGTLV